MYINSILKLIFCFSIMLFHSTCMAQTLYGGIADPAKTVELKPGEYGPLIPYKWNSPKQVGTMYKCLKIIDLVLKKHNIPYWIDGGCLLGAMRHNGFIPWDGDADIEIHLKDQDRFYALKDEFLEFGMSLFVFYYDENTHKKIPRAVINSLSPQELSSPPYKRLGMSFTHPRTVDIFSTIWDTEKKWYRLAGHANKSWWQNRYFPDELFPLKRIKFGPIEVSAPNKPMAYINRYYGESAMEGYWWEDVFYKFAEFLPAEYEIAPEDEWIFELNSLDDYEKFQ